MQAVVADKSVCLKNREKCLQKFDTQYHQFGFHCHAGGRLTRRPARAPHSDELPRLTVLRQSSLDAPGYVFIAPKQGSTTHGPEIVDERGRPVWFQPAVHGGEANDFRVQTYRGKPVLTWWQDTIDGGIDYVADTSYRIIATVHAGNGLSADGHEFALTPQGTALITIYHEVPYDLSSIGGPKNGTAIDCIAQEIDVETGRVLFEWHSLDHVPLTESYARLDAPSDYFHMNAVNLDGDGNLLISGRHTWTVYKVDRRTGQILWRLGGKRSDFQLGPGVKFAWQHNPLPAGEGTIRIIRQRERWEQPDPAPVARDRGPPRHRDQDRDAGQGDHLSRGHLRRITRERTGLANGDTFVGWGQSARVSEFDRQGKLLFDAGLSSGNQTYRAYRAEWSGQPDTPPTATGWTNPGGTTTVHAIWNGATTVAAWRILAGPNATSLSPIRTAPWNGLDTTVKIAGLPQEVEVVALDARGGVIGTSQAARVR